MEEKVILQASMLASLIGLLLLYLMLVNTSIEEVEVKDLISISDETAVKINGAVVEVEKFNLTNIVTVKAESYADVIVFEKDNVSLKEGDSIRVTGKMRTYNGKRNIIADKITVQPG